MPGYKILLRIVLILALVAGIGFGIYFIITSASGNSMSTFNKYKEVCASENTKYLEENFSQSSDVVLFINTHDEGQFNGYYTCYNAQKLIFNELGHELYLSTASSKDKRELEKSMDKYPTLQSATIKEIKSFLETYNFFKSVNSDEGTTLSTNEINQLKSLMQYVTTNFKEQVKEFNNLTNFLYSFVNQHCLNECMKGSLKYDILDCTYRQNVELYQQLTTAEFGTYAKMINDTQDCVSVYNTQKSNNFANQLTEGSTEWNVVLYYNSINEDTMNNFFKAIDKKTHIQDFNTQVKQKLNYIITLFGWGD